MANKIVGFLIDQLNPRKNWEEGPKHLYQVFKGTAEKLPEVRTLAPAARRAFEDANAAVGANNLVRAEQILVREALRKLELKVLALKPEDLVRQAQSSAVFGMAVTGKIRPQAAVPGVFSWRNFLAYRQEPEMFMPRITDLSLVDQNAIARSLSDFAARNGLKAKFDTINLRTQDASTGWKPQSEQGRAAYITVTFTPDNGTTAPAAPALRAVPNAGQP